MNSAYFIAHSVYFIPKFGENNKNVLKKALQNNRFTCQLMKE